MEGTGNTTRQALVLAALFACLFGSPRQANALNPALDISQYGHTSWKIRDGAFNTRITVMAQTPDGYLWLGTELGLLRFDGVRSVPWQPPTGQSLPHSWIRSLYVARDGGLWIGTLGGLARWHEGVLRRYAEIGFAVDAIVEDRAGTVWVGGSDATSSARLCDIRNDRPRCRDDHGELGRFVSSLFVDDAGALWLAASTGLWQWSPGPAKLYGLPDTLSGGLQSLVRGDKGPPLIATRSGVAQLVSGRIEPVQLPSEPGPFRSPKLLRDRDGGLWIGTLDRGLVHVHEGRTDVFTRSDGLSGDVSRLFEDREGNIWIVTIDGLDRFREIAVTTISAGQGVPPGTVAAVLASPDGSVWLSAKGVLSRWKDGRVTMVAGRDVQSLFRDSRDRVWVAMTGGVGYVQDDRITSLGGVPGGFVNSIAGDDRGVLWIANQERGLIRLSVGGKIEAVPWSALKHADGASRLVVDPLRGGLWIGFLHGGLTYYLDGRVVETYSTADAMSGGRVADLRVERDGTLWAATERGLTRVKSGRIATLTSRNGLPCDGVHWTMEDDSRSVWLRLDCGFVRIARADLSGWEAAADDKRDATRIRVTVLDNSGVRNGLTEGSFGPLVDKATDGRLWFAKAEGAGVIDPRHLPFNRLPPPVHIEQITANHSTHEVAPPGGGPVRLPPLIHDLRFDYTALSLVAPETIRFRYRLEGWDSDWQDVGNQRQAFYANLPPRNYRFRVIAANNSGVWNEAGAAVDFSIAPAYYQANWFRVLSISMVVAIVWAAHRLRLRIVERHEGEISALNERLMKAQEQERIRIAGELHDGVMQQMLAVTMMLGTAKRKIAADSDAKTTIDRAQEKLVKAGTDLRQLSHGLHPPVLQDLGLPQALRAYCDEFSAASGIAVTCEADDHARDLSRGAALALFRIVQEALGNAAKHASAHHITVRLSRSIDSVSLNVSDDGVGFERTRLGNSSGLGLITMRERAGQLNGTFDIESAPGRGTTISVKIPFR
jgi:signal transduction histidine kinase/ligand-binding sensor domain-containing protein